MAPDEATEIGASATSDDAFLGGALHILQPRTGYRAGSDAVLLAAAAPLGARSAERLLDVGAGVGTVGLCIARRVADAQVVLLERDAQLAALARQNVDRNGLAARIRIVAGDVTASAAELDGLGLAAASFDHVVANPPFHAHGRGTEAADKIRAGARAMPGEDLERWVRFLARMAVAGGSATIVHKAEALGALLAALDGRFGALKVLPLHPRAGEPAARVIVQGVKGSRGPLTLLAGFVLHGGEGHAFTPAADAVLRHGAALPLG